MANKLLRTFFQAMEVFRPALTAPGYQNAIVLIIGWILDPGAVTFCLVATSVSGVTHHEKFHRFFSRGSWEPDALGQQLLMYILRLVPEDKPIRLAVDDTLAPKKGPHVFGIGNHVDAVRSTKSYRVFCFGHCWVVVCALFHVPFSKRVWALPILFRLYRSKKTCANKSREYRKKTELAREMIDLLVSWVNGRRVEMAGDSAYCNNTVMKGLPPLVVFIGDMRPDAVLTDLPHKRKNKKGGPRRKRGTPVPKPSAIANDDNHHWKRCDVTLRGRIHVVRYKDLFAQWYRAAGITLLHIVIVKVNSGKIPFRVFFSTDKNMSVSEILHGYAGRWSIEVCFRELKQLLGFADSSARKKDAVLRTAPFVGYIYTLLVIWFVQHIHDQTIVAIPIRPWYRHKRGYSFADILRTARRIIAPVEVFDLPNAIANLTDTSQTATIPPITRKMVA